MDYQKLKADVARIEEEGQKMFDAISERKHREEQNKQTSEEKNTEILNDLVVLLRANGEKQEEILEIITEIFAMSVSQDKEAAENQLRKIMDRISKFSGDIKTMQKLSTFAFIMHNLVQSLL